MNGLAPALGYRALDPPPFAWLAGAASLASLYLVILILTTQIGDDRLTQRLELLNLELTILSEEKIAKVVALLEELRQDSPHLRDRVDELAEAMSQPADPQSVIDAIKETRSESLLVFAQGPRRRAPIGAASPLRRRYPREASAHSLRSQPEARAKICVGDCANDQNHHGEGAQCEEHPRLA